VSERWRLHHLKQCCSSCTIRGPKQTSIPRLDYGSYGPEADLNELQTLFLVRRETYRRCVTMASMFRFRIPPSVLLVVIIGGASCIFVFYGLHLLMALIALNLVCLLMAPIARRRGWGAEGRLSRHLSRPPFDDESRRAS
jgi:hypothetical protein